MLKFKASYWEAVYSFCVGVLLKSHCLIVISFMYHLSRFGKHLEYFNFNYYFPHDGSLLCTCYIIGNRFSFSTCGALTKVAQNKRLYVYFFTMRTNTINVSVISIIKGGEIIGKHSGKMLHGDKDR